MDIDNLKRNIDNQKFYNLFDAYFEKEANNERENANFLNVITKFLEYKKDYVQIKDTHWSIDYIEEQIRKIKTHEPLQRSLRELFNEELTDDLEQSVDLLKRYNNLIVDFLLEKKEKIRTQLRKVDTDIIKDYKVIFGTGLDLFDDKFIVDVDAAEDIFMKDKSYEERSKLLAHAMTANDGLMFLWYTTFCYYYNKDRKVDFSDLEETRGFYELDENYKFDDLFMYHFNDDYDIFFFKNDMDNTFIQSISQTPLRTAGFEVCLGKRK